MNINLSSEALLSQLGYTPSEQLITQIESTIKNTNGFENFSKHILALHDQLAHVKGVIALSNSKDYFKIKGSSELSDAIKAEFETLVHDWAKKYKVTIEQVENRPTYYIIGQ